MSLHARLVLCVALCTILVRCSPLRAEDESRLRNPNFADSLEHWETKVYGARPRLQVETDVVRPGRVLRISSREPSDTAAAQEVNLKAGRFYRFSGWVRTSGLEPQGAPVHGTFQIQNPAGKGTIASGANHRGDTSWTETSVYFRAPPGGRVRVVMFFVGFGKGTGSAWFADLKLEELDLAADAVHVTRKPLCHGEISPLQYGQFIEYLCDLVPGMWAEKLYDGGFEGLSPYKFAFLKEKDFREKPWYPSGAVNRAELTLDRNKPVSGAVCQKIAVPGGAPCTVGVAQDGIFVDKGKPCTFSCYLRKEGFRGPVTVRLHREGKTFASCQLEAGAAWKKHSAKLVSTEREINATLAIEFRGPGTLWIDNASLMPDDAIHGWRPDVVEALRALKPGVIRFGGSALDEVDYGDFDWRDTVGNPDRRRPFRAWGGLQPTGAGLEEIVQLCRDADAEPLLCVRFSGRTPKDAAEQVEYFNGGPETHMGKLRAKNGHTEPYRIRYWQVGNERSGADYESRLADFCKAMKRIDGGIKILSSYPSTRVLGKAGTELDYVCPHHYDCEDLAGEEESILSVRNMIHHFSPTRPIKIAVTEWNTTAGDWGPKRAKLWTLENALACSRYHNLLHRHADVVEIANRSNLTNSFCSGIIQTDNHRLYKTPTYYAQQLYATKAGNKPLVIESKTPASLGPDFSATLSPAGDAVILFAVNSSLEELSRPLDFSAFGTDGGELMVWTLADRKKAGEPDAVNSFGEPDRIGVEESKFKAPGPRFSYRFPALSVTALKWKVQ
jgi:alpha-L-arabinofuranosidase